MTDAQIDGSENINLVGVGGYPNSEVRFQGSFGSAYLYFLVPRVILFSGMPVAELRRIGRKLGATGYVKKGASKKALLKNILADPALSRVIVFARTKHR